MKFNTENIKWYIIISILLIIMFYQYFNINSVKANFKNEIEKLHKQNDSLVLNISVNKSKIKQLDSLANIFKTRVEQDKAKLDSLKFVADKNKQKYDKEHNRINTLSNSAVASEFTNTFN